jgi:hypothetical protein
MDRLPLTYVCELSRGKNAALNTGLASVEGDLVVLTDDDILPRLDWLKQLRLAADSLTSFSLFGGPVIPRWEIPPTEWILPWQHSSAVFGATNVLWEEGPIAPDCIFGGNMAIRTLVFEAGYRFNPDIGPRGKSYAMGSETELTIRLGKAGFESWHCKEAVVEHMVRKFQMTRGWILRRAVKSGRGSYCLINQHESASRRKYLGIPECLIHAMTKKVLGMGLATMKGDSAKLFERRFAFNYILGQMIQARLIHKARRSDRAIQGFARRYDSATNAVRASLL